MSDTKINISEGDILTLEITEINNLGAGVARYDGIVVFVKGGVSGDTVRAKVIKTSKSFVIARLEEIITPSPYREAAESGCHEPASCGGCVWRNVTYEHELEMKRSYVRSAFIKAGIAQTCINVLPVAHTDKIYRYRNKAQYPVCQTKSGIKAGFYATKTHHIIPISDCVIQNEEFAPIVNFVCDFATKHGISAYDEKSGKGVLRHIYLRSADKTGQIMLCLVLNSEFFADSEKFVDEITERFPKIVSIMLNVNRKSTNVVLGDKYKLLFGKSVLEDELCRLKFKIAPEAFYQVNHDGAELLYGKAAELATNHAKNEGKPIIVDLYCGTGTIGLSMANKAQRILGIDIVEKSIECAKENAALNNIQNAEFCSTDAGNPKNIKRCLCEHKIKLSDATVIIDPPRKGSTPELISFLSDEQVKKIVYISCNPDTLARDAALFISLGYKMSDIQPVNMFPRTAHVECCLLLCRE